MVTDGNTALRISLTHRAVEKFKNPPEPETMSKIKKGIMLQLSKFTVIVPLSKDNPKIQVEVHEFRISVSIPQPIMGHPSDIDTRTGVVSLVKEIQPWNRREIASSMRERSALPNTPPAQLNGLSRVPQPSQGMSAKGGVNLDRPTGIERYEGKSPAKKPVVQEAVRLGAFIRSEVRGADPHHRTEVSAANSISGASPTSPECSDEDMSSDDDAANKSNQNPTPINDIAPVNKYIEKAPANQTEQLLVSEQMDISDWNASSKVIKINEPSLTFGCRIYRDLRVV
jgi:hypothetical protein